MEAKSDPQQRSATSQIRQQAEVVGQDLKELGRLTKDAAREAFEDTRKSAADFETKVTGYVREKPIKSVLIAAGVGILLGAFLSRR